MATLLPEVLKVMVKDMPRVHRFGISIRYRSHIYCVILIWKSIRWFRAQKSYPNTTVSSIIYYISGPIYLYLSTRYFFIREPYCTTMWFWRKTQVHSTVLEHNARNDARRCHRASNWRLCSLRGVGELSVSIGNYTVL